MVRPPVPLPLLGAIFAGGAVGTAARAWLQGAVPAAPGAWPWATWGINVAGALLLGVLLETLAASGPDVGWRRAVRLGVGTGMLGGFTTYSAFALDIEQLLRAGAWWLGLGYAVGTLVAGVAAAAAGTWATRRALRGRAGVAR